MHGVQRIRHLDLMRNLLALALAVLYTWNLTTNLEPFTVKMMSYNTEKQLNTMTNMNY